MALVAKARALRHALCECRACLAPSQLPPSLRRWPPLARVHLKTQQRAPPLQRSPPICASRSIFTRSSLI